MKKEQVNFFGGSAIGKKDADKKIDILATALTAGFTASDLAMLELSYMPKYNTATDIINVIGSKGEINNEFNEDSVYWLAMDTLFMIEYNRDEFQPIATKKIEALESEEIKNAVTTMLTADEATTKNHEDATKAYETMKEIHAEILEKFKKYIKENDYTIKFFGKRATAAFSKTEVLVPKDSAEIGMKLSVVPGKDMMSGELNIVDHYGNPVEEVKQGLTYSIPTSAFNGKPTFTDGTNEITAEVKDDKYVFTTKATHISYTVSESKEATTETETKPKTTPQSVVLLVGAVIVVAIAAQVIRKKLR